MTLRAPDLLTRAKASQLSWQSSSEITLSPTSLCFYVFVITDTNSPSSSLFGIVNCCQHQAQAEMLFWQTSRLQLLLVLYHICSQQKDVRNVAHERQGFSNTSYLLRRGLISAEHTRYKALSIKTNEKEGQPWSPVSEHLKANNQVYFQQSYIVLSLHTLFLIICDDWISCNIYLSPQRWLSSCANDEKVAKMSLGGFTTHSIPAFSSF